MQICTVLVSIEDASGRHLRRAAIIHKWGDYYCPQIGPYIESVRGGFTDLERAITFAYERGLRSFSWLSPLDYRSEGEV